MLGTYIIDILIVCSLILLAAWAREAIHAALELTARFSELDLGRQVFTGGIADPNLWTNKAQMIDVGFNSYLNGTGRALATTGRQGPDPNLRCRYSPLAPAPGSAHPRTDRLAPWTGIAIQRVLDQSGMSARIWEGRITGSRACAIINSIPLSPTKGGRPVSR
jgi:hypothetical protein